MLTITDINAMTKKIEMLYEEWMQPLCKILDIPYTALCVLLYFGNNPSKNTAHELCKCRGYKRAIVSIHIEMLVQRGYLERKAVEGDRRKFGIVCTKKATPFIAQGKEYHKRFEEALTTGLRKEDFEKIEECFNILQHNIESMAK